MRAAAATSTSLELAEANFQGSSFAGARETSPLRREVRVKLALIKKAR